MRTPAFCLLLVACSASASAPHPGEGPYRRICFLCHDKGTDHPGALGAPRLGNQRAWETRAAAGVDALFDRISKPHPDRMPMPRADLTDEELRQALRYMLHKADPLEFPWAGM